MYNRDLNAAEKYPQETRPLRAACVIRVSTTDQSLSDRSGIPRQRAEIDRIIESKGYLRVMTAELIGVSGTAAHLSPEFQALMESAERKEIDVVVCSEFSRLNRANDLSSFVLLDVLKTNGVLIDAGGSVIDLSSPEGFLSGGIQAIVSGVERMGMLRKMIQAKEASRAAGRCPGSAITLPHGLGYNRSTSTYYYTESIWQIIEAFRLLDEEGIRNLSELGRRVGLQARTLAGQLRNKCYIGIREYTHIRDQSRKGTKSDGTQKDRPKILRATEKIIRVRIFDAAHQAVDDERYNNVQQILQDIKERHSRIVLPGRNCNILTGVGFCAFCSLRMTTATSSSRTGPEGIKKRGHVICSSHHSNNKHRYSKCGQGWLRKERVDKLVAGFIGKFLEDPDFLGALLSQARLREKSVINIATVPASIKSKLADIEKRDQRVLAAIEAGVISLAEAKERRLRLDEEKRALRQTLELAEKATDSSPLPGGLIGRILSGAASWQTMETPKERKALLMALFSEIMIKGESITAFKLSPGVIGPDSDDWSFVRSTVVTLPTPYRLTPEISPPLVPAGYRHCGGCDTVLPGGSFYKANRSRCKSCEKRANNERHRAKVAAMKPKGGEQ